MKSKLRLLGPSFSDTLSGIRVGKAELVASTKAHALISDVPLTGTDYQISTMMIILLGEPK
jgi:hypothetical protein